MKRKAAIIIATIISLTCYAGVFVCSNDLVSTKDSPSKKVRGENSLPLSRIDLVQAYSGQPVLVNNAWLTIISLPLNTLEGRTPFIELDISPDLFERTLYDPYFPERRIKIVQNNTQLIREIGNASPAVGYASTYFGSRDTSLCFKPLEQSFTDESPRSTRGRLK